MKTKPSLLLAFFLCSALWATVAAIHAGEDRPNVLWITCEDMDPNLGCFGDNYAVTPNLDALAEKSVRYARAFATAPACSPARSCLITGVWPNAMGTPHLRDAGIRIPGSIRPYPQYLREAGYYCTNNAKQDYNFAAPKDIWDESSGKAHWRNRPDADQPFFAVFNLVVTHQGQLREKTMSPATKKALAALAPEKRHDPAQAPVPPYYPDTPVVRQDIATHYDCISAMDEEAGGLLDQLEADGLGDNTIVFFYSDHGRGMPRHKRWLNDGGLHVPLIIHFPKKWRHLSPEEPGAFTDRLVSFLDFPATLLSLAGLPIPEHMQGVPFAGKAAGEPRHAIHASRDRVDEVIEVSRCVRTQHYKYIRHFLPHRPMMQFSWYSEMTPTRGELRRLAAEGKLEGPQAILTQPAKPIEELYDVMADPCEIHNLAGDRGHFLEQKHMREKLRQWMINTPDACLLPIAMMHELAAAENRTVYEMAHDPKSYPVAAVVDTADLVGRGPEHLETLTTRLEDPYPGVRYWAAVGLRVLGAEAEPAANALKKRFADDFWDVRIAAAEALCQFGDAGAGVPILAESLQQENYWVKLHGAAALHAIGDAALPALPAMKAALAQPDPHRYLGWGLGRTIERLEAAKK